MAPVLDIRLPQLKSSRKNSMSDQETFIKSITPVITVGRLLGVISRNDVISKKEDKRSITFSQIHTVILTLFFVWNFILHLKTGLRNYKLKKEAFEKLNELTLPGYSVTVVYM